MSDLGQLFESIGERAKRRPPPRLGIVLAAAGVAAVVTGVLAISSDQARGGNGDGSGTQLPGILLCGAVVAGGYALVAKFRSGPFAAAGVAASVLPLPPLLYYLTYDEKSAIGFNLNATLLVAIVVYGASYLYGPGRGHTLYLAGAVIFLWAFVMQQVKPLHELPGGLISICSDGECDASSYASSGVASLAVAIGYLGVSRLLDRRRLAAAATPFVFAGLVALTVALTLLERDAGTAAGGVAVAIAGAVTAYFGATAERRGTAWYGAFGVLFGIGVLVEETAGEGVVFGFIMIGAGIGLVMLANLVVANWQEQNELEPGPSKFAVSRASSGPSQPPQPPPTPPSPWQPPPPPVPPSPPIAPSSPSPASRRERPLRSPGREES